MTFDLLGALASLLSTYYFIRLDTKAWPTGILATLINARLYFETALFANAGLELFYFASILYGWYLWHDFKKRPEKLTMTQLSFRQYAYLIGATLILFTLLLMLLNLLTDSTTAKLDALTTSLSIMAQGLMCYKVLTTWILWFIVDTLFACLYLTKHLPFHALLMLVYTSMAVIGYISWQKHLKLTKYASI